MTRSLSPLVERAFWFLLTALGYYLLAAMSLHTTKGADNITAIWPSSGYFLALLLLMPARARPAAFLGMILASTTANLVTGVPPLTAAAFSLANGCEALVALRVLRHREPGDLTFMSPRPVASFCIAALSASLVSASIATLLGGTGIDFFLSWMTTVALGMLIVTPPIVMLARMLSAKAIANAPMPMKVEAAAMLIIGAAMTTLAFSQSTFPATFVPCLAVLAASYRFGPVGAAVGMLAVTIITSLLTGQDYGPIAGMDGAQKTKVLFLQFYLLTMLLTALPLAALLVMHQRLAGKLEQSHRRLLQAEEAAHVGHWRVDLMRQTIQWSDQAYRIHGLEPGTTMTIETSLACYVAEDSARVRETLERALASGSGFEFHGRIIRPDDEVRHVKSHGSIEMSRSGKPVGIFGTVQDVTQTVENARVLEAARSAAERVANTDMLTGLPNRRHTLAFLEQAVAGARAHGGPLAVAIFDIDHFKRINDAHGHGVGDDVIRHVAQRAQAVLREGDMVGRVGGEEFVCIFQRSSARAAELAAERIRKAIEKDEARPAGMPRATISIGLAIHDGETDVETLLHRADQALYAAKRAGRNRVRMAA